MTEIEYIKSKMNWWDKFGANWAFVPPLAAILFMIYAAIITPEYNWWIGNPITQTAIFFFVTSIVLVIIARRSWTIKISNLKDEYKQHEPLFKNIKYGTTKN